MNKVIKIQEPNIITTNEPLAIRRTPISISNIQKSKIPRFSRKKFESMKINDENETSANRKGNDKPNELGNISRKASQQTTTPKFTLSEQDRNNWDQSQIKG